MNILELCVVPALGGLELYFHRCCVELLQKGHLVLSVRLSGSRLEELARRDGILAEAFSPGNRIFPLTNARRLASIVEDHRIDVVHAHHKDDLPLVALTRRICKKPIKVVFTRQMPLKHRKKDPYHRWLYSSVDLMITITDLLKRDALEKIPLPADKIKRLYYGVAAPPARDEQLIRELLTISQPGDFNIGVFSRLEFQKGQHLVVEALSKLRDRNVPAKLYIVGDVMSPQYKELLDSRIAESHIQDHIVFKGFLPNPAIPMMAMDVLVLPSRSEAFGLVVIEAMRCGVAVVGVNAGGVPEIIDHEKTGLLFEWDNTDQLTSQLEHLYRDPNFRKDLALRGKKKADEEFNKELHFDRLEEFFLELIAEK